MKDHKEMFEALLAGETLIDSTGTYSRKLLNGKLATSFNCPTPGFNGIKPEHWHINPKTINAKHD